MDSRKAVIRDNKQAYIPNASKKIPYSSGKHWMEHLTFGNKSHVVSTSFFIGPPLIKCVGF